MKRYLILTLALLVAGCASQGTRAGTAQLDQLKPGRSTISDAERLLGPPRSVTRLLDGGTALSYSIPALPAVPESTTAPANAAVLLTFNQAGFFTNRSSFQRK
jgi:hypothetical protein